MVFSCSASKMSRSHPRAIDTAWSSVAEIAVSVIVSEGMPGREIEVAQ
jgi:hypothetical protein